MSIHKEIKELRERLIELEEKAEKCGKVLWHPEPNGIYYFVTTLGLVENMSNTTHLDKTLVTTNNCFKTEAHAKLAAEYKKDNFKILKVVLENDDGWVADWKNTSQGKFYVTYDYATCTYETYSDSDCQNLGTTYMSKQNANKLCELLNEGLI
jgi:hypothetical protein